MAASVANFSELILEIMGSSTPAVRLLRHLPFTRSSPQYLRLKRSGLSSPGLWAAECRVLNLEMSSVASLAALTARVLGMMFSASLNSAIAICSLVSKDLANCSRWMLTATSTAPPPATTLPDSRVRFATQMESWRDLNYQGSTSRPRPTSIRWRRGGRWCRHWSSCTPRKIRNRCLPQPSLRLARTRPGSWGRRPPRPRGWPWW